MTHPAVEAGAEAMWQEENIRVMGKKRYTAWEEESEELRNKWRGLFTAAIRALLDVPVSEGMIIYGASKLNLPRWGIKDNPPKQPAAVWQAMLAQLVKEVEGEAHDK